MKPAHAAALALVGWYLMMPPFQSTWFSTSSTEFDAHAAPSRWRIIGAFDSASACYFVRGQYRAVLRGQRTFLPGHGLPDVGGIAPMGDYGDPDATAQIFRERKESIVRKRLDYAECFASDDPRLAK